MEHINVVLAIYVEPESIATPSPTVAPTQKPTSKQTQKPTNSGYNYTSEEYARLTIKGIQGTLTYEEAELLQRYYQYYNK